MLLFLLFAGLLLFSFTAIALMTRMTQVEQVMDMRLRSIRADDTAQAKAEAAAASLLKTHSESRLAWLEKRIEKYAFYVSLQTLIVQSATDSTPIKVMTQSLGCAGGAWLLLTLVVGLPLVAWAAAAAGLMVPVLWLRWKRANLVKKFEAGLPDAIDLMVRALRAGHSINSAIEVVAEQSVEPVAGEFHALFKQQAYGLPFRESLLQMAARFPSRDLQFLVTAMLVQKETGGNLTEILDRTSNVVRERLRIRGEVRVHTAQGRLTGWILGLLPVGMLVLINVVNPGYSHVLMDSPTGQKILYVGMGLMCIGGLVIRKIVNIEV
jgi:tight adherence protein B